MVYFNSGVNSALSSGLVGFKSDVFSQFAVVLPLALGILITLVVVHFAIRMFMKLIGVGGLGPDDEWVDDSADDQDMMDDWNKMQLKHDNDDWSGRSI